MGTSLLAYWTLARGQVRERNIDEIVRILAKEHIDSVPTLLSNIDAVQTALPIASYSTLRSYCKSIADALNPAMKPQSFAPPARTTRPVARPVSRGYSSRGQTFPAEVTPHAYEVTHDWLAKEDAKDISPLAVRAPVKMPFQVGAVVHETPSQDSMVNDSWEKRFRELQAIYNAQKKAADLEQGTPAQPEPEPTEKKRKPSKTQLVTEAPSSFLKRLQQQAEGESTIVSEPLEMGLVWMTQFGFTASTILLAAFWISADESEKGNFVTTMLTCAIAAGAYYAKGTGYGEVSYNGRKVPLARYIDWITTTPLMLYELCHLGGATFSTTLFILGCDLITLSFGLVSAFLDRKGSSRQMLTWFFSAGFFYVMMMLALHGEVARGTALNQAQWVQDLFNQLTILTSITWSCYPIVVFLGRAECHLITKEMEEFLLVVLDILSKMGMEALIVVSHVSGHGGSSSDSSGSA